MASASDAQPPMRPVGAAFDPREPTPSWKVAAVILASGTAGAAALAISRTAWWIPMYLVSAGVAFLLAWSAARRTVRENADHRMPWFRKPVHNPRRFDLRSGAAGGALVTSGLAVPFTDGRWWLVGATLTVWLICALAPQVLHNVDIRRRRSAR
ncbi:MAG: hypothetical protein WBA00_05010 [Rhodococcus sp. (in: high G+C Gram-positive bacteria)]